MSIVNVLTFKAEHILQIKRQSHDLIELQDFTIEHFRKFEPLPWQWSIEVDGVIKACCGVVSYWQGRGEAWAMIDQTAGVHMIGLVRALKRIFATIDCTRVEATVIANFEAGHRLVKLLGFDLEAPLMRKYGNKGWDYSLYARVK